MSTPESVWDYPRPPRLEPTASRLVVEFGGVAVADTSRGMRVLETSQPPTFYFPPDDVRTDLLVPSSTHTVCEWKGVAGYATLRVGDREAPDAAWTYADPTPPFAPIRGWYAFYPQRVDACFVDGEEVQRQDDAYYGGWITSRVIGL